MQKSTHIEDIANDALLHANEHTSNGIWTVLDDAGYTQEFILENDLRNVMEEAIEYLANKGLIEYEDKTYQWFKVTDSGRKVKQKGGISYYEEYVRKQEKEQYQRQLKSDEKLDFDLKNAKRVYKTYWWTFTIAILAFLLSVGKILYDIVNKN